MRLHQFTQRFKTGSKFRFIYTSDVWQLDNKSIVNLETQERVNVESVDHKHVTKEAD